MRSETQVFVSCNVDEWFFLTLVTYYSTVDQKR